MNVDVLTNYCSLILLAAYAMVLAHPGPVFDGNKIMPGKDLDGEEKQTQKV